MFRYNVGKRKDVMQGEGVLHEGEGKGVPRVMKVVMHLEVIL